MNIKIDGRLCEAQYGEYLLEVARDNGIFIPSLCHSDALPGQASCRICAVEVIENGHSSVVASCVYPITKEIEVITNSEKIINLRRALIKLLAARVPYNDYINKLKEEYSIPSVERFTSDADEQCILCGLCVRACEEIGPCAISTVNRGIRKKVSTPYDEPSEKCIGCEACAAVCPTDAIKVTEEGNHRTIWGKSFELLKCISCSEYFITREHFEYLREKLDNQSDELLCEKCKRRIAAEGMKDIYQNVTSVSKSKDKRTNAPHVAFATAAAI